MPSGPMAQATDLILAELSATQGAEAGWAVTLVAVTAAAVTAVAVGDTAAKPITPDARLRERPLA